MNTQTNLDGWVPRIPRSIRAFINWVERFQDPYSIKGVFVPQDGLEGPVRNIELLSADDKIIYTAENTEQNRLTMEMVISELN